MHIGRLTARNTPRLLQESLGFLTRVIPPRVAQRMLSAALSMGPRATAATTAAAPAAAAAATSQPGLAVAAAAAAAAAEALQPANPGPQTSYAAAQTHQSPAAASPLRLQDAVERSDSRHGASEGRGSFGSCTRDTKRSVAAASAPPQAGAATDANAGSGKSCSKAAKGAGLEGQAPPAAAGQTEESQAVPGPHNSSGGGSSGRYPQLSLEVKTLRQKVKQPLVWVRQAGRSAIAGASKAARLAGRCYGRRCCLWRAQA